MRGTFGGHIAPIVAACDKLDNPRSLIDDLHSEGPETLKRFSGNAAQTRWHYESVCNAVSEDIPQPLLAALDRAFTELRTFIPEASPEG